MIATSAPQWLMVAAAIIASSSPSAVSWLYFANRLVELPLGIVGVAMGAVLIPQMTLAVRSADPAALAQAESRSLELAVGLALPATLGLAVLSAPIVRVLFQHGAFDATDSAATAQALAWLALGLPAHVLVKSLSPAFFAREDTLTPLIAAFKAVMVTAAAALLLGHLFGPSGIAAAIALGAWSNALSLIRAGAAAFGFSIDAAARQRLPRIVGSALAMGAVLWLATWNAPFSAAAGAPSQIMVLLALIATGMACYAAFLSLFGVAGWRETVNVIRRNRAA